MDASDVLLAQWTEQVKQIWRGMHQYRQEGLALAVLGIVLAGNAVIQRVAETLHERLSNPSKMSSYERQMQRLIDNENINVTTRLRAVFAACPSLLGPTWSHVGPRLYPV